MEKLLSILIPTLPDRIDSYGGLLKNLFKQRSTFGLEDKVQLLSICDTKEMSVGEKRNYLYNISCGRYIQYLDDDDKVAHNYLQKMVEGASTGKDVVTFKGEYHENGVYHSDFIISNLVPVDSNVGNIMYRRPNHVCAVKREIAAQCVFPNINFREDSHYADLINKLIKTEHHIDEKLYFYIFDKELSQTHIFKTDEATLNVTSIEKKLDF